MLKHAAVKVCSELMKFQFIIMCSDMQSYLTTVSCVMFQMQDTPCKN